MRRIARTMRWLLQAAFLASIALMVLAIAALTGKLPAATRALVEWSATQALGTPVHVERFRGSLLGAFELEDVSIAPPDLAPLTLRSIQVEVAELSWAKRRAVLASLVISGAALRVQRDPDGWSIAGWRPPARVSREGNAEEEASSLRVRRLVLREIGLDLAYRAEGGETATAYGTGRFEASDLRWPADPTHAWPLESRAEIALEAVRWTGRTVAQGTLRAQQRGTALELEFEGDMGGPVVASGRARLAGAVDAPAIIDAEAALRFRDVNLGTLAGDPGWSSALSGELDGKWDGAVLSSRMSLERSRWGAEEIRNAELVGRLWPRFKDWRFELETVRVAAAFAEVEASAAGNAAGAESLVVRRLDLDLAALPPRWRPHAAIRGGRVDAEANLSGPWRDPHGSWSLSVEQLKLDGRAPIDAAMRGEALGGRRLRVDRLVLTGLPGIRSVQAVAPFEVGLLPSGASIQGARLQAAGGMLEVDGGFGAGAFQRLHLAAQDLELTQIVPTPEDPEAGREDPGPGRGRPQPGGRLDADFELEGPLSQPRIDGFLAWSEPRWGELAAERIELQIAPAPEGAVLLAVSGTLVQGGVERLELEARLSSRDLLVRPKAVAFDAGFRADVTLHQFEWAALAPLSPDMLTDLAGPVDGVLHLQGPLESPAATGRLIWQGPRWRDLAADRIDLDIEAADGAATWQGRLVLVRGGNHAVEARFELPARSLSEPRMLLHDPSVHLSATLRDFELAWLAPIAAIRTPALAGRLDGTVRIAGEAPVPRIEGELQLLDLRLAGPPLPGEVGPASGRLSLLGHRAELEELRLLSGEGEARLSGHVDWEGPGEPALAFQLHLTRFAVVQPGTIEGLLDGSVVVEGKPSVLRATGGLRLSEAAIDLPEIEDPVLREIRVRGLPENDSSESIFEADAGLLGALEANVTLEVGDSVWLRGLGAELELQGELRVRKRPHREPGLFGSVETNSGRIDFQRKWLRIEQGTATFDGSPEPDPYLDITAVHQARDVEIRVRIFGKASAPQIELDSDPPLSSEEQLAYLLFDRPMGELGSEDQEQLGTAVGVLAADALLGEFGSELARKVGLDRIRLGMDEQAPVLEVEKQLHPRLTARYGRSFGADGGDRFVLEWRLFRRLFLIGDQRTSGESGVGVLWRYDF